MNYDNISQQNNASKTFLIKTTTKSNLSASRIDHIFPFQQNNILHISQNLNAKTILQSNSIVNIEPYLWQNFWQHLKLRKNRKTLWCTNSAWYTRKAQLTTSRRVKFVKLIYGRDVRYCEKFHGNGHCWAKHRKYIA